MVATWIEAAARGRSGGPVRAGMWSAVVVGTHPVEADQEVWLELSVDDVPVGPLPAYWVENKGVNSLWHVPIPPQAVGVRLHYRSGARHAGGEASYSPYQDAMVRPNLPDRTAAPEVVGRSPEGLVGNRMMTARVDARGSTYDVYFPTVGLHADVRPAEGDLPQSRSHFRAIVGGLALGWRLDWFAEAQNWEAAQRHHGATNLLVTELSWRHGPVRVRATDFVAMGPILPQTMGRTESPGQYLKRYRVTNEGPEPRRALFGVYIHAEVNGGIGEPGLSWHDGDRTLLATNRGHGHGNRKLARDATVEFAVALDDRGEVYCEPTGPNEAILLRWLDLPAGGSVTVDLLVSGAFTGWRGDPGTFEHWLRPALAWFRSADLDAVEAATAGEWDAFIEVLPRPQLPRPSYAVALRRSALTAALHCDARWGAIASGFDRGLHAYCWPRDAIFTADALDRLGHRHIGRALLEWLWRVRGKNRPYAYWFQKYTIDGTPEWETPAADQTALIPWALERWYRRSADAEFVLSVWPMVEQAAAVCAGASGHPGLRLVEELNLISSAGLWDTRYGAFFYTNACVVAGLRAAARLAEVVDRAEQAAAWRSLADRIWELGVLPAAGPEGAPGLLDPATGRFLESRRLSLLHGLWAERPEHLTDRSAALDVNLLAAVVPLDLLPAADARLRAGAEALLVRNAVPGRPHVLCRWSLDPDRPDRRLAPGQSFRQEPSSLASFWMARYLIRLGRETGEARHWGGAVALLDAQLGRLAPLGVGLRPDPRNGRDDEFDRTPAPSAWGLHALLIDTVLDLSGLDYDAPGRHLVLAPALPPSWPAVGAEQPLSCGEVSYRLERRAGGGPPYRLTLRARLHHPVTLQAELTCPGLDDPGPWQARPAGPPPRFDRPTGRLSWAVTLPEGESDAEWSWGHEPGGPSPGV